MHRRTLIRVLVACGLLPVTLAVTASPALAAPVNDAFADAVTISGTSFYRSDSMAGATTEPGEPDHSGKGSGATVWYSWTAPSDAVATIRNYVDTPGGTDGVESTVAVYTGTDVADLTYVAGGGHTVYPVVSFDAAAGRTYRIAIWGPAGTDAGSDVYFEAEPTNEACTIEGTSGNDTLTGTAEDDVICGLGGDDTFRGLNGDDVLLGGPGRDVASFAGAAGPVTASLTTGSAYGQGGDTLDSIEDLVGSAYPDALDGGVGANHLSGRGGDDRLRGQGGGDTVLGGDGDDVVVGRGGDDSLGGGAGRDALTGGAGGDVCRGGTGADTAATCETRVSVP